MLPGTEYIAHNDVIQINEQQPAYRIAEASFLKKYLSANKSGLTLVVLLGLISSIASFLLTVIIGDFFILQFQTGSSKGKLLMWLGFHLNSKNAFFLTFGLLLLIKFVAGFYEKYLSLKQGELFVRHIRHQLFSSQMRSSVQEFNKKSFGKYLLRYSNDLKAVQQYLIRGIIGGIKQILFVSLGIFLLFKLNWQLALILTCSLISVAAVVVMFSGWQKKTIRQSRDKRSRVLAFVAGNFSRFESLKKEKQEDRVIERFKEKSGQLYHSNLANGWMESFIQSAVFLFQFAIIGICLWLMGGHGISISAADGLIVVLLLLLMQGAVRGLLKIPGYLNKGKISIEKINELIRQVNR